MCFSMPKTVVFSMCFSSNSSIVVTDPRVPHITPPRQEWGPEPGSQECKLPGPKPKINRELKTRSKTKVRYIKQFNHFFNSNTFQIQIFQMFFDNIWAKLMSCFQGLYFSISQALVNNSLFWAKFPHIKSVLFPSTTNLSAQSPNLIHQPRILGAFGKRVWYVKGVDQMRYPQMCSKWVDLGF